MVFFISISMIRFFRSCVGEFYILKADVLR